MTSFGDIGDPGFSGYLSPALTGRRWCAIENVTGVLRKAGVPNESKEQIIPGFACCYLNVGKSFDGTSLERSVMHAEDGQAVWLVDQPNDECECRQDPTLLIVNGPTPIPPGGVGRGTQQWPAQVLVDSMRDSAGNRMSHAQPTNGTRVGPAAGEWGVYLGRTAFAYVSHDATVAARREPPGGDKMVVRTGWVTANQTDIMAAYERRSTYPFTSFGPSTSYGRIVAGQPILLPDAEVQSPARPTYAGPWCNPGLAGGSLVGASGSTSIDDAYAHNYTLEAYRDGVYWLSLSGSVRSTDATDGEAIGLGVYLRRTTQDAFALTEMRGYRLQSLDVEGRLYDLIKELRDLHGLGTPDDLYSVDTEPTVRYTRENIAFAGPIELLAGDQIQVRNTSATWELDILDYILSSHRLGFYSTF